MVVVCILYIAYGKRGLLQAISAADMDERDLTSYEWRRNFDFLVYFALGVYIAGVMLGIWFFYIVLYCYVYFKEKETAKNQGFVMMQEVCSTSAQSPW